MKPIEDDDELKINLTTMARWDNLQIIILITLILMAWFVGDRMGYRRGYTYVQDWYDDYIEKACFCKELETSTIQFYVPSKEINTSIEIENTT